jgi:hypothetical protein
LYGFRMAREIELAATGGAGRSAVGSL